MLKRMTLVRVSRDNSREDALDYWMNIHSELVAKTPGVLAYRVNAVQEWIKNEQPWDGIAEMWFESRAAMDEGKSATNVRTESARRLFLAESAVAIVRERIVIPGP